MVVAALPQIYNGRCPLAVRLAALSYRHFERSREIFIAERSSPDVRQHQDIVFPRRIHADSRSAVKIEGCARDDDTEKGILKKFESRDEWLVTGSGGLGARDWSPGTRHQIPVSSFRAKREIFLADR